MMTEHRGLFLVTMKIIALTFKYQLKLLKTLRCDESSDDTNVELVLWCGTGSSRSYGNGLASCAGGPVSCCVDALVSGVCIHDSVCIPLYRQQARQACQKLTSLSKSVTVTQFIGLIIRPFWSLLVEIYLTSIALKSAGLFANYARLKCLKWHAF